jgi:transcriptional regulator with XRE-family HTH domain
MTDGSAIKRLPETDLLDDFYDSMHRAYSHLRVAFKRRAETQGLSQDDLATKLGSNKAIISKRLRGRENLTLKSLSYMASALDCRLNVTFEPYEEIRLQNEYFTNEVPNGGAAVPNIGTVLTNPQ